jgi:hypothetical protein
VGNDRDQDGLTDAEEVLYGTDPDNADTDGDSLLDGWEVKSVDGQDLAAQGASPLHKDVFVEMDYMVRSSAFYGIAPNAAVIEYLRAAFDRSPVPNPDGSTGVHLHLQLDSEVPYDEDLNPVWSEFNALKQVYFNPQHARTHHYMIWANQYQGGSSSGVAFVPGTDFIVTLGKYWSGGTDDTKIGTFMHELGHNLGLRHGGADDTNYKPNYLSVMSYRWQFSGVQRNGAHLYDYQPFALPTLDEHDLDEAAGLGAPDRLGGYQSVASCPNGGDRLFDASGAVDWNCDADTADAHVAVNLNASYDSWLSPLTSQNDWARLIFNGGGVIGSRGSSGDALNARRLPKAPPVFEMTFEEWQQLRSHQPPEWAKAPRR